MNRHTMPSMAECSLKNQKGYTNWGGCQMGRETFISSEGRKLLVGLPEK